MEGLVYYENHPTEAEAQIKADLDRDNGMDGNIKLVNDM